MNRFETNKIKPYSLTDCTHALKNESFLLPGENIFFQTITTATFGDGWIIFFSWIISLLKNYVCFFPFFSFASKSNPPSFHKHRKNLSLIYNNKNLNDNFVGKHKKNKKIFFFNFYNS